MPIHCSGPAEPFPEVLAQTRAAFLCLCAASIRSIQAFRFDGKPQAPSSNIIVNGTGVPCCLGIEWFFGGDRDDGMVHLCIEHLYDSSKSDEMSFNVHIYQYSPNCMHCVYFTKNEPTPQRASSLYTLNPSKNLSVFIRVNCMKSKSIPYTSPRTNVFKP